MQCFLATTEGGRTNNTFVVSVDAALHHASGDPIACAVKCLKTTAVTVTLKIVAQLASASPKASFGTDCRQLLHNPLMFE
jgi:hypothetical protein